MVIMKKLNLVALGLVALAGSLSGCVVPYHRPVYVAPRPVYVAPRPVYVAPRPVYVAPRPVYVAPRPAPAYVPPPAPAYRY
jgi:hypothetical protein